MEEENKFYLQVSNSLNQLADKLSEEIKSQQQSVFQPVYIVTQTEGMNSWLKLRIAELMGIAANIQFLKPNDLINQVYFILGGPFTKSLSSDDLNWLLYKVLGEKEFIEKFPRISDYYNYEGIDKEVKRMALAEKVADLFDQYQIYRPDMIQSWNQDKLFTRHEEEKWQKELWQRTKNISPELFPDKTLIGKYIHDALKNPEQTERLKQKMPFIYLFGISVITEYHLEIFQNLSRYIDIHFLLLNPAPYDFWYEDKSEKLLYFLKKIGKAHQSETSTGNALLTAWGKILQDTFSILFKNDTLINSYDVIGDTDPGEGSLLHKIQASIFENRQLDKGDFTNKEIIDGSVNINSCYGPAREVESLYNYLTHLVDQKKETLSSRDIIVMVSDIDLYASYIKAVFDNAPYKFQYTIADESYAASDSISNALHNILSLTEQEFTAEAVVRLLDFTSVRSRHNILNTSQVRDVVDAANIRFGIEGDHADDSVYVSWKYGLKRIMYGICISGGEEYGRGEDSFFPMDNVESSDVFNVIRFVHFAEALIQSLEERKQPKKIAEWVQYVEDVLNNFVINNEENQEEDYGILLTQLENYNTINDLFDEKISYEVFAHNFLPTLTGATRSKAFAGGGITFCSLIPMRSIPFKVVCLLGMNFDKFPRKEKKTSFNLIEKERRKGDRNIKENDKHLFLETLLSAQKYLYISYTGQSVKDNSSLPPSILVDELLDYIESASEDSKEVRAQMITKHPLHPFSKKYSLNDSRYYSYLLSHKDQTKNIFSEKAEDELNFEEIQLHKLISFLKSPVKGYYNNVLGIYYNDDPVTLQNTEVFELDHLEKWDFKNQVLKINEEEIYQFKNEQLKKGKLPLKNMAPVVLHQIMDDMAEVKEKFIGLTNEEVETVFPIHIELDQVVLKGTIGNIYGDTQVAVSFSKRENKYMLEAWINYLALRATGVEKTLQFVSQSKNDIFKGTEISQQEAMDTLKELVGLYKEGHKEIMPFDMGLNIIPDDLGNPDTEKFNGIFGAAVKKMFDTFGYPCSDAYLIREYEGGTFSQAGNEEKYRKVAEKLLLPLARLFPSYPFKK